MLFLLLLMIALPLVRVPSQVQLDNAGHAPRLLTEVSAIPAGANPLSDDARSDALNVATLGAGWPTVVSHTRVAKPIVGDTDANRPGMLAQGQQSHRPGGSKTIADVPDGARETKESCLDPASIHGPAPEGLDLAAVLNDLGVKAWEHGELSRAEQCHCQALAIRQKLAPRSLHAAESYNNLGTVEQQLGDLAKAEKYERNALAIRQALAPDGLAVAETLHGLGRVYMDRGDFAKAEKYLQRSLDIRLKLGPGSRDLALSFIGLANLAARRGDPDGLLRRKTRRDSIRRVGSTLSPMRLVPRARGRARPSGRPWC